MTVPADLIQCHLRTLTKIVENSEKFPVNAEDHLAKAQGFAASGEWNRSLKALENVRTTDLAYSASEFLIALADCALGNTEAACDRLQNLARADYASYDILCLSADLALDAQRPDLAIAACDKALELAPHASHALLRRGKAKTALPDIDGAIADLTRATLLQPTLTDAHIALADAQQAAQITDCST